MALMILGSLVVLPVFMALQGAVIFETARRGLRLVGASHWRAKTASMTGSYLSWIAFTIGAYLLLGGEGGLMDGFLLVLYLCFTAMISSLVFLIGWLFYPSRNPVEEEVLIEPWA